MASVHPAWFYVFWLPATFPTSSILFSPCFHSAVAILSSLLALEHVSKAFVFAIPSDWNPLPKLGKYSTHALTLSSIHSNTIYLVSPSLLLSLLWTLNITLTTKFWSFGFSFRVIATQHSTDFYFSLLCFPSILNVFFVIPKVCVSFLHFYISVNKNGIGPSRYSINIYWVNLNKAPESHVSLDKNIQLSIIHTSNKQRN